MYTAEDIRTAVRRQKKSWVSDWCDCFRYQIPYETQEGVPQSYSMEIGIEAVYSALGIPEQTWKKQDWKNPMVQRKLVTPFRETRMYQEICQDIAADMNRNGWIIREQEPKRKQKIPGVSVRFCPGGSELQEALAQGVFREARNNFNALCLEVGVSNKGLKLLAREIQQDFLEGRCTPEQILRKSEQGAYSIESMRSAVRSVTIQDVSPKGRE